MAKKRRLRIRPLDFPADGNAFVAAVNEAARDSPRAAAIVAAALVEDALRWCLCGFLIPAGAEHAELPADDHDAVFDNESAPLRTFHAKIVIGYSLGIYGKITLKNLKSIKTIRNFFAHSPHAITFDTPDVAKECVELSDHFFSWLGDDPTPTPVEKQRIDPREHYVHVTKMLVLHLHAIGYPDGEYAKTWGEML